jgi:hypothetical protein
VNNSALRLFRHSVTAACLALVLVGAAQPASGQRMDLANPTCPTDPNWSAQQPMQFTVRAVNGRPVLFAEGFIDENLIPRLREALDTFDGAEVWLRSPGGDTYAGTQAGLLLRNRGLSTRIPSSFVCHAACALMFMGGVERSVDTTGYVMLPIGSALFPDRSIPNASHEVLDEIARQSAMMATANIDYLIRMGVSRALLRDVMYSAPRIGPTRRCLSAEELRRYQVVTD